MQRLNYLVVQDTFLVSLKSICKGHSHWLSKYSSWSLMGLYGDLKQTKADPLDDTSNFKANQSMRKVFQSQSVNEYVKTFKKVVHEITDLQIESPCWPDSIWLPRGLCILYTQHTILAFLFSQGSRLTGTKTLKLVTEFK